MKNNESLTRSEGETDAQGWGQLSKMPASPTESNNIIESLGFIELPERLLKGETPVEAVRRLSTEVKRAQHVFSAFADQKIQSGLQLTDLDVIAAESTVKVIYSYIARDEAEAGLGLSQRIEAERDSIAFTTDEGYKKTIEAQSGRFFRDRYRRLLSTIEKSKMDGDEAAAKDYDAASGLVSLIRPHLRMIKAPPEGLQEELRESNEIIRKINTINALAKKYRVDPLTVRDFVLGETDPERRANLPVDIHERQLYDRGIVEAYYMVAFPEEVERIERGNRLMRFH